ncbi:MAG: sigma-70 family RNA polymerase sigma factor [Chloroflexota bacterium]|nr:sigma-70 family RNA polymerase sigma factor [Chloroflexota bacterium]
MDVDTLVSRAKAGDAEAFGALYDLYAARVYRFVVVRVPQPADGEDLMQQVFLKVIESLPRYEQRGLPFGAWLFRIARNTVIDFGRTRRVTAPLDDEVGRMADPAQPGYQLERAADVDEIRAALGQLTSEQRDVIVFRFFAELTHAEIGAVLGKREGTIRVIQHRALAVLRGRMTDPARLGALAEEA